MEVSFPHSVQLLSSLWLPSGQESFTHSLPHFSRARTLLSADVVLSINFFLILTLPRCQYIFRKTRNWNDFPFEERENRLVFTI